MHIEVPIQEQTCGILKHKPLQGPQETYINCTTRPSTQNLNYLKPLFFELWQHRVHIKGLPLLRYFAADYMKGMNICTYSAVRKRSHMSPVNAHMVTLQASAESQNK
jgi:hypothetical protein